MNLSHSVRFFKTVSAVSALLAAALFFIFPETVFRSLLQGFETAFCRVVPAVFPMMIVSGVILESPLVNWLGLLLFPYVRLLGIRSRAAAAALFLGLLGGFAVLAQCIDRLYRCRQIDRRQAELLLCAGLNAGPSFILLSIGYAMLGSTGLGLLLLSSLYLGNLCSAVLMRCFRLRKQYDFCSNPPSTLLAGFPQAGGFNAAVQRAVSACTVLCGFIAFFCLVCAFAKQFLPPAAAAVVCAALEVTNGALFAAQTTSSFRLYFLIAVLGWSGLSIQLQAKALLPAELSLRPFYRSRLLSIPLSTLFYGVGIRLFPQTLPTLAGTVLRPSRFSGGILVSFLLMVAAFLYECTPNASLRIKQKAV